MFCQKRKNVKKTRGRLDKSVVCYIVNKKLNMKNFCEKTENFPKIFRIYNKLALKNRRDVV